MRITDRFRNEHQVFLEQLDVLQGLLAAGEPIDGVVTALRTLAAPLSRHARREEEELFPAIGRLASGPIGLLVEEHRWIEARIEAMAAAPSRLDLERLVDEFARTLREHIAKEDEGIFPIAERVLGNSTLNELDRSEAGTGTR